MRLIFLLVALALPSLSGVSAFAGFALIVLFFGNILLAAAALPNLGGVQVNYQSVQDTSALPDTSSDPTSPHWTDTQISDFVAAVQQEQGSSPQEYYYIHITRTVQGVQITYAICYAQTDMAKVLMSSSEQIVDTNNSPIRSVGLSLLPDYPVLSLTSTNATGQTCSSKFVGALLQYGGHSGNFVEMLPYLPAAPLQVAKWSWWAQVLADINTQAIFEHWHQLEVFLQGSYSCAHQNRSKPSNPFCLGNSPYTHDTDSYLNWLQGLYGNWSYDAESGQTYNQQNVMASCGGVYLAWQYPFGCAIQIHNFRTEIWAGGTGYTSGGSAAGSVNGGQLIYSVNTDLVGRVSESTLFTVVYGAIKNARTMAALYTQQQKDQHSTWTAAGWTQTPDSASNTVTGKQYDSGQLHMADLYNVPIYPVMNDVGIWNPQVVLSGSGGAYSTLGNVMYSGGAYPTQLRLPVFFGVTVTLDKHEPTLCGADCQKTLGDYVISLASQGKLLDAAIFLNSGLFPAAEVSSASTGDPWQTAGIDSTSIPITSVTPDVSIARWKYFYDNNKLADIPIQEWINGPGTNNYGASGSVASMDSKCAGDTAWKGGGYPYAQNSCQTYLYWKALYSQACAYWGPSAYLFLRDNSQEFKDGTYPESYVMVHSLYGNSCPVQRPNGQAADITSQLLSLFGIRSYSDASGTYIQYPSQYAVLPVGYAGVSNIWLNDYWLLAPIFSIVLFGVALWSWRRRRGDEWG